MTQAEGIEAEIAALRKRLADRPRDAEAQRELGLMLLRSGRVGSAIQALRAALDLKPRDVQVLGQMFAFLDRDANGTSIFSIRAPGESPSTIALSRKPGAIPNRPAWVFRTMGKSPYKNNE